MIMMKNRESLGKVIRVASAVCFVALTKKTPKLGVFRGKFWFVGTFTHFRVLTTLYDALNAWF